jgi:hypothetical protein
MSTPYKDDENVDDSPTDELPVLSEMDVVEDFERTSVFLALEDKARHPTLAEWAPDDQDPAARRLRAADALPVDDTEDSADTARRLAFLPDAEALEARLAELTARCSRSDAALTDKDATIASLEERLEATRRAVVRRDET